MQVKPIHYIGVQFTFFVNNNHSKLWNLYKEEKTDNLTFPVFCYDQFIQLYDKITNGENVPKLISWAIEGEKSLYEVCEVVPVK